MFYDLFTNSLGNYHAHFMITIWFPVVRCCDSKSSVGLPRPIELDLDTCSRPIARENAKGWLSLTKDMAWDFSAYHETRKLKTKTILKTVTQNSAKNRSTLNDSY